MIIRLLQLGAFALIATPLILGIASFDPRKALQESGTLSLRAKEFISTQKETGTSLWNEVTLQTPPPTTTVLGTQSYRLPCFEVTIPWPHLVEPTRDSPESCILKVKLSSPRGRLVIQATPTSAPLKEQTAVVIRYQQPEQFTPVSAPQTQWPQVLQFQEPDATTLFLSSPTWTVTVAATGLSDPSAFSFGPLLSSLEMSN